MNKGEDSGDKDVEQKDEEINNPKIQAAGKKAQVFTELNCWFLREVFVNQLLEINTKNVLKMNSVC